MKRLISVILTLLVLTTGCAERIQEGTVSKKEHRDPWVQLILIPMTTSNGKTFTTTMIPMWIFHPESWVIAIEEYSAEEKEYKSNRFYVTKEVFDNVEVGYYFVFDKEIGSEKEPTFRMKQSDVNDADLEGYELITE